MSGIHATIECVQGDLTLERTDAIVNAANSSLMSGGGVDGAIHAAAGPGLLEECMRRYPEGCPTGEARITGGHQLAARHVIHAVGPVWRGGHDGEPDQLAACYVASIRLAAAEGLRSIAFPAISCGAYRFPHEEAAETSLQALIYGARVHPSIELLRMVLFEQDLFELFEETLARLRR